MRIDLGACLFCTLCQEACPEGAIVYVPDHRLAARSREDLIVSGTEAKLAASLDAKMRKLFRRSLKLRQVSAGGCNGCEAELVAIFGRNLLDDGRNCASNRRGGMRRCAESIKQACREEIDVAFVAHRIADPVVEIVDRRE